MRRLTITVVVIDTGAGYRYFSNGAYITQAGDTPALQSFESRLMGDVTWSREMSVILWGGSRATGGLGGIGLANTDGQLDGLRLLNLRGNRLWVYTVVEGESWASRVLQFSALMERIEPASTERMTIISADLLARLEKPLCTQYSDADDVPDQVTNRSRPVAIGRPFSCPAVLVDEVDYVFDCHDGHDWYGPVVVRDQGYPITLNSGYIRSIDAGRYGIEKLARALGRVVVDVAGATVQVAEIVGTLGDFTSGLAGWSTVVTGLASITPSGGALVWFRDNKSGTASLSAGALTIGNTYLFRVTLTSHTSGSLRLMNGATAIGTMSAAGVHAFAFVATSTSWNVSLVGPSGTDSFTIDNLRLQQVRVIERLPDVIRYLAITRGGLSEGDVNWDSVYALDTECPWKLALWADGAETIRNVLDQVLDSFCGCAYEDRLGRLAVGRLRRPGTMSPVATITQSRLVENAPIQVTPDLAPGLSRTVAGARNWYRYGPGELADDALLDPLIPVLTADFRERRVAATSVNPVLGDRNTLGSTPRSDVIEGALVSPAAGRPPSDVGIGTLLVDGTAIQAAANHIASLYPVGDDLPEFIDFQAHMTLDSLGLVDPFDELVLAFDRFGDNRPAVVRKIDATVNRNQVSLGCWVAPEDS